MSLQAIIVLSLIVHLRKKVHALSLYPQWERVLTLALYVAGTLLVLEMAFDLEAVTTWVWHAALLLLLGAIYKNEELSTSRLVALAALPISILYLVKDVLQTAAAGLYAAIDTYFDYAEPIAITWMIALLVLSRRQQKALDKEQAKRLKEEEQNKLVATRRAELEVLVLERTAALTQQKEELQHALSDLKATQAQLVQREKMASLGELTAGIAHEIQNPLNFVNNFSEVNGELIVEMKAELLSGNAGEAVALANDIGQNLEKIAHHGKRADAIVKGMLLHSRTNTDQKEPTDVNALADEYLRLSYHGLRAKDKSFNAEFKTYFDETLGKINLVSQDVGRVLLNLFNNAFYAVQEKAKAGTPGYKPTVTVTTKKGANKIEIVVEDNGMGISKSLQEKIFQPFFTTKPTGQGTGLGLSLSYDIVKAHGGEVNVKSEEGKGTEFIIELPIK